MKSNMNTFRVFGPDENTSNKLDAVYEVSKKLWLAETSPKTAMVANWQLTGESLKCSASTRSKECWKVIC